ncbi:MAG TPA: hypothetical protein VKS79_22140 [Gemmataceae bacterium]|nr:hypothetical protein [Gemmataceae bacterium]
MLAIFSLRLALGMLGSLFLLSPSQMHPRFFRTHFLTVLGLCMLTCILVWPTTVFLPAIIAVGFAFLGAIAWYFERSPLGWILIMAAGGAVFVALRQGETLLASMPIIDPRAEIARAFGASDGPRWPFTPLWGRIIDDLSAAALLGFSMTAMLVGHSYLISPGLSIRPLMLQLGAFFVALLLRLIVAGVALWFWTADHSLTNLNDEVVLWLPVRWLIGIAGPAFFGFLAYRTAKIRSTQSATGILYVVVILVFLGELNALLLQKITGLPL